MLCIPPPSTDDDFFLLARHVAQRLDRPVLMVGRRDNDDCYLVKRGKKTIAVHATRLRGQGERSQLTDLMDAWHRQLTGEPATEPEGAQS